MPSNKFKIILLISFFIASIIGFMIKLPRAFHHMDKELHGLFYCGTFLLMCIMFPRKWIHFAFSLVLFGCLIEYAQDFSNKITLKLIGKRIHGRFDPEDIKYNLIGLVIGIIIWRLYKMGLKIIKS